MQALQRQIEKMQKALKRNQRALNKRQRELQVQLQEYAREQEKESARQQKLLVKKQNMERVKLERAQMREKQRLEKRRIEREKILASIPTKFEPRPIAIGDLVVATSGCNYGEKGVVVEFAGLKVRIKSEDGSRVWNLQSRHNFVAYDEFAYVGKTAIQKPVFKDVEQLELPPFSTPDDFVPTPTTGAIKYADQRGWNIGRCCLYLYSIRVCSRTRGVCSDDLKTHIEPFVVRSKVQVN
jgi:hypothetical protein